MNAQSWSKHAILYEIDTRSFADTNGDGTGDLKGITQHLDYIKSLGIDAILLEPLAPTYVPERHPIIGIAPPVMSPIAIDPALGTLDDFDDLSLQASRRGLRILLNLPIPDASVARFWLARGVAGFHISGTPTPAELQAIRKLLPRFVGQRILITDIDARAPARDRLATNELILDSAILNLPTPGSAIAMQLHAALDQSGTLLRIANPILVTDAFGLKRSLDRFAAPDASPAQHLDRARILATALLLNRSVALIFAGQELGLASPTGDRVMMPWGQAAVAEDLPEPAKPAAPPATPAQGASERYVPYVPYKPPPKPVAPPPPDPATAAGQDIDPASLLNFYRQLGQLHHGNPTIRDGDQTTLPYDASNSLVWVRRPLRATPQNPPVLIVCNLNDQPQVISITSSDILPVRPRSFLRTLLRSDTGLGGMSIDAITVPPNSVYVGELRY